MRLTEHLLTGDGDFRSPECLEILENADVVVTNPPFSLFREYVAQLVEHGKKFLIIGQTNAITFKEIFPLVKANKLWLGYGFKGGNSYFRIPKSRVGEYDESFCDREKCIVHFRNCSWITNMDHGKRHEKLILTEKYDPAKYPKYDNYDAIHIGKTTDIPKDWNGVMGVPITFFDKYNQEQFEIVGELNHGSDNEWDFGNPSINGKIKFKRILIRRKPSGENKADRGAVKWPKQETPGLLRPVLNNKHLY